MNSTLVKIVVRDVQNTPPKFIGPMAVEISEETPINSLILSLQAVDGDTEFPRKVQYNIVTSKITRRSFCYEFFIATCCRSNELLLVGRKNGGHPGGGPT